MKFKPSPTAMHGSEECFYLDSFFRRRRKGLRHMKRNQKKSGLPIRALFETILKNMEWTQLLIMAGI
jgi:hypothetical protein